MKQKCFGCKLELMEFGLAAYSWPCYCSSHIGALTSASG